MTKLETLEILEVADRLLHTHRVEAIQLLCDTGLSQQQAKRTWLSFVQSGYSLMEECLNTLHTRDS